MDIIREGKDKKDDWASECAIRNPHCPKEGFIEILRREKKLYSKQEMINAGADGYFSEAILLDIPVEKIIGREPIPASYVDEDGTERQFLDKRKIFVPIEVEYDDGQFVLYGGNHRLRQAEINGDKYIKAFVYCHDKNYKKLWNK
jgi:hypothetical protein